MPSIRVDRNRVRVLRFPSRAYRRRRRCFCSNNCPCFFLLWERDRLRQTCRPRRGRDNVAWTLDKPRRICRYLQCVAGYNCDKARAFPWLHGDLQSKFNRQHDLVTATTGEGAGERPVDLRGSRSPSSIKAIDCNVCNDHIGLWGQTLFVFAYLRNRLHFERTLLRPINGHSNVYKHSNSARDHHVTMASTDCNESHRTSKLSAHRKTRLTGEENTREEKKPAFPFLWHLLSVA